jgi:hypothetical protein
LGWAKLGKGAINASDVKKYATLMASLISFIRISRR